MLTVPRNRSSVLLGATGRIRRVGQRSPLSTATTGTTSAPHPQTGPPTTSPALRAATAIRPMRTTSRHAGATATTTTGTTTTTGGNAAGGTPTTRVPQAPAAAMTSRAVR